jgi:hypothetical protein
MGIKKLYKVGVIILVLQFISCQIFFREDDKLTLQRKPYNGSSLKLDGYYYQTYLGGKMVEIYFLFKSGVIINAGAFDINKLNFYEKKFSDSVFVNKIISLKYNWGVFQIDEDSIKFERWYPSEKPYRTGIREGYILNDSTFVIIKAINSKGKEISKNEIYHFKQFEPKIDSVSKYID